MRVQPFSYLEQVQTGPPAASYDVSYLIVGGGGGAGYDTSAVRTNATCWGGGGGAGGLQSGSFTVDGGTNYSVIIGAGGSVASNGSDSSVFGLTSLGGGFGGFGTNFPNGGAAQKTQFMSGSIGGSGGGGSPGTGSQQRQEGAPGTIPQGNSGSWGMVYQGRFASCGGGGGASEVGEGNPNIPRPIFNTNEKGGNGGAGSEWIDGNFYAGGGGGGFSGQSNTALRGLGGIGGGGSGRLDGSSTLFAQPGAPNTGGGGGGSMNIAAIAAAGGSGVVIIGYEGPQKGTGGTVTTSGTFVYHTFTASNTYTG